MASIEQCPGTSEARTSRSNINKCPTLDNYHCLKTEDGQLRELCTSPIWIEAGKCPIYSVTGKLDARICKAAPKCPTNVYKSNLNFNYPGCLPSVRQKSPTPNIKGEQTTQNSSLTLSGRSEVDLNHTVFIVAPLLVVFFVILGIGWWKRKEIQKRRRDFITRIICVTQSDVEAVGTSECPATQASTVSHATDKNKAESQSMDDHGNAKKTKENIQESGSDNQDNQSLLNADDSAKKNSDKKTKKEKSKEKKPEFTPDSIGKNKSVEKTEENIQASDKTHEENQSLLNADESATEEPNKKANGKELKGPRNTVKRLQMFFTKKSSGRRKNNDRKVNFVSTQPTVTTSTEMEISAEHFGKPQEKTSKKVDSVSTQSTVPVPASIGLSSKRIGKNQSPETSNDIFVKAMSDLLLDKEVLVLVSSLAKERIVLAQEITLKTCENTQGTNMRMVQCFDHLRCLEMENRTIVTFIHDTFVPEKPTKSAIHDTFEIIQNAIRNKDNEVRALFSLPKEGFDDFNETLKKSSLKYAVYDLSTKQEHTTKQSWLFFKKM